jgi:hypothetical protein
MDGAGVGAGYAPYVAADIAAGRLVAPFHVSLPSAARFDAYVVQPATAAADAGVFCDWLLALAD